MGTFAANPIYRIMYSSEDLERFYFQYQSEALPHGEFLQSFCVKNKVPYNIFQTGAKRAKKSPKAHTKTDTSSQEKLFEEIQNSF